MSLDVYGLENAETTQRACAEGTTGRAAADAKVEAALFGRATGYDLKKTEIFLASSERMKVENTVRHAPDPPATAALGADAPAILEHKC
jgi:hypothetical protein